MSKTHYDKDVEYLTSLIKNKNELIAYYKSLGRMGAVSVLNLELGRVESRLKLLQLNAIYQKASQEVTMDELTKMFNKG